jgi:hypothetical protein
MKCAVIPMLAAALLLSACAGEVPASRSVSDLTLTASSGGGAASVRGTAVQTPGAKVMMGHYRIKDVRVNVPRSLRVSEANSFLPVADIVWRGDPLGDRYQQVGDLFVEALKDASVHLTNGPEVILQVDVTRFHGVTEKTRYTVGGIYAMHFDMTVIDATTGQVLEPARTVVADLPSAAGAQALADDSRGRTERVVVTEHLAKVFRKELSVEVDAEMLMSRGLTDPQSPILTF